MRPDPTSHGLCRVYSFPSDSRPGLRHFTIVSTGGVYCSCEGWSRTGHCWHIDKIPYDHGGVEPEETEAFDREGEERDMSGFSWDDYGAR